MCKVYNSVCTNDYTNKCCDCGKFLKKENQWPRANPYVEAVCREKFMHMICDKCHYNLVQSI